MIVSTLHEAMGPHFDKWHINGLPFPLVLHRFTAPDHGDPHDHPWGFRSVIERGSYVEEEFDRFTGRAVVIKRCQGDSFFVPMMRIHRIVDLPQGECWTTIRPDVGGPTQKSGFWRFEDGKVWHRHWDSPDWRRNF